MKGDTGTAMGGSIWVRPRKRSCEKCAFAAKHNAKGKSFCKRWQKTVSNRPDLHQCFKKKETAPVAGEVTSYRIEDLPETEQRRINKMFE